MRNLLAKLFGTLFIFSTLLVASCGDSKQGDDAHSKAATPVHAYKVESKQEAATEKVPGSLKSKLRASIEAKVSGRIEKMLAVEGKTVKEGDLLAELDVKEIKAKLDQAIVVRDQAERDLQRSKMLLEKRAGSQADFENMNAKAQVSRAAVTEAETMLSYASIRAPFDGIITKKLADVGDLAIPGRPIIEMEDPSALRFEANVPETLFNNIKMASELDIDISGIDASIKGVVAELSPTADPNSRTFLVKLDLPNEAKMRAGQFGHVLVPSSAATLISIPKSAIVTRGQMKVVYVVRDGKAWLRLVRTGKKIGENIEILSGLEDGEQIVADGASDLRDSQLIQEVK